MQERFRKFARRISDLTGSSWAFLLAVAAVVAWLAVGPWFHYSDTWQLVINTGTTIVTFLMVFLIQNTQNRDSKVMQLKLDELLRAVEEAHRPGRPGRRFGRDVDSLERPIQRARRRFSGRPARRRAGSKIGFAGQSAARVLAAGGRRAGGQMSGSQNLARLLYIARSASDELNTSARFRPKPLAKTPDKNRFGQTLDVKEIER